jgi:hypothetical protein
MTHASRNLPLCFALLAASLSACSGSSSDDGASVSLAVTDAATDELSTFTIGVETVELLSATGAPVSLLQIPTAVDFAALSDLSRVLNVTTVPPDTYTGLEVVLLFDGDRVHVNGVVPPATLLDAESGLPLTGTLTMPIDFTVPLDVTSGNYVIELDLDLAQSADVDAVNNEVSFEPALLARVNRNDAKEHAIGGDLRTVVLGSSLFRIGLEAQLGDPTPVVEVEVGPGTVFQIDGTNLLGAAGLAMLDGFAPGSWVQAFGSVDASSRRFQAATVEAGTGSYNGGTDIVEGVIVDRAGGAGADAVFTVRGHSNNSDHTVLNFNLDFVVNTAFASTKVVRRGSSTAFDTDDLNVGQKVRVFGALTMGPPNVLDATLATDVVRMEPTWVFGTANEVPGTANPGQLEIDLARVDRRDVGLFDWADGGTTPPTPTAFTLGDPSNLSGGQGIVATTPIVAVGFFAPVDDAGADFVASVIANRALLPSLLLIRDRANGMTVTTTTTSSSIDYDFMNAPLPLEKGVVDMGFAGQTDITAPGISLAADSGSPFGLGVYVLRDRTLNTISLHLTFTSFYQAVEAALTGGAQLFNVGAVGTYDSGSDTFESAIAGVTVR